MSATRTDLAFFGPLEEGDLFVLMAVTLNNNTQDWGPALLTGEEIYGGWTLGLVAAPSPQQFKVGCVATSPIIDPSVVFSSALTGALVNNQTSVRNVRMIYFRYRDYQVGTVSSGLLQFSVSLEAVDPETSRSLGFLTQDLAYLEEVPSGLVQFGLPGEPPTSQLYAGVPFLAQANNLNWGYCWSVVGEDEIAIGSCPNYTQLDGTSYGTLCGGSATPAVPFIVALPLNYYLSGRCSELITTRIGDVPLAVTYQQCVLDSSAPWLSYLGSSNVCQNRSTGYTSQATCQAYAPAVPIVSPVASGSTPTCGAVGYYLPYEGGIRTNVRTYATSSLGPCPNNQGCLYNGQIFYCEGEGGGEEPPPEEPPPEEPEEPPPDEEEGISLWLIGALLALFVIIIIVVVVIIIASRHSKPAPTVKPTGKPPSTVTKKP